MTDLFLISLASFLFGLVLFPILFYIQNKFSLPVPDLAKKKFHIHHSFYGLLLIAGGIILSSLDQLALGLSGLMIGLGFIVHHKLSEPQWRGLDNFIYRKKND